MMKKQRNPKYVTRCLCLTVLLMGLTTACSEVSFTPAPGVNGKEVIDFTRLEFTEFFIQNEDPSNAKVDILVVVDNSGSMATEQAKMGDRIQSFLGHLDKVDWQIGITTTDVTDGAYGTKGQLVQMDGQSGYILKKGDPDYLTTFLNTVTRSSAGSGTEEPLAASIMAMQLHDSGNLGFFRSNADTAIVILTDEDEMSSGPVAATSPQEVIDAHNDFLGQAKKLSVNGIIIMPGDTACYDLNWSSGGNYGNFVNSLITRTQGVVGSICDDDYGKSLESIGKHVASLSRSVELSQEPDPTTVTIAFNPVANSVDWIVDGRFIRFIDPPEKGTEITVVYNLPEEEEEDDD